MENSDIHPTTIIEDGAIIHENCKIGPFCSIGPNVEIGPHTHLQSHVIIDGHTKVGSHNMFHSFTTVGSTPQDLSYKGEPTRVEIGNHNIFREFVSISRGTLKQDQVTKVGDHSIFMAYVHLGHDVTIGNNVRIVNACNLAGHVHVMDNAIISGGTNISQFVTIGKGAFLGGGSGVDRDIPCYTTAYGNRVKLKGINIVGIKRMGHEKHVVSEVVEFFRTMEASALSPRAFIEQDVIQEEFRPNPIIKEMMDFITLSDIGIAPFMS